MKLRIRLANFETRDLLLRWEHGRFKIDGLTGGAASKPPSKKLPAAGGAGGGKKITPPKKHP